MAIPVGSYVLPLGGTCIGVLEGICSGDGCHNWNLIARKFSLRLRPSEHQEVAPGSKERTHTSAQQMENFMDIVHLEKLMKRTLDHFLAPDTP